jgi:hypothetical protein
MEKPKNNAEVVDLGWRQIRQLEGRIVDEHLLPYVHKELPEEVMGEALSDLFIEEFPETMDKKLWFHHFFIPWFLFNWAPCDNLGVKRFNPGLTISQNYIKVYSDRLEKQEKRFLEAINKTYYSFYSIQKVEFEKFLEVKDILLGTVHVIKEKMGTHSLKKGDIVFSRIVTLGEQSIFVGMAPYSIPVYYNQDLIDYKEWLMEENENKELTPEDLREEFEFDLIEYFFSIMVSASTPTKPLLYNADGNKIQFTKSYFDLKLTPEETIRSLLPLTKTKNEKEFLMQAERDKHGVIKRAELPWIVKKSKARLWGTLLKGNIIVSQKKLILETNSLERDEKGKKLLSKYLGDKIIFKKMLIEDPHQKLQSFSKQSNDKEGDDDGEIIPEVQAQIEALAKKHWKKWFDEPIPALQNKTPRQATQTKHGRERLEALLLQYERHNQNAGSQNLFKPDVDYLRSELGLD